ncbi:hypothetical protein N7457_009723 [Penicillium paradoxum]|uniref:uncharacterized protein n=1 Tax=Penicillium paradoxum TaxID=176176 RepID=UPI00254915FC|nr:uncharacterized protein N7457_009723 [Penicillium paradoxum]KAJ5774827.1 hypothetical protein N7457_009723 [Penicillium paradoxum]
MDETTPHTIALIGLGTIGLSFAALHLKYTNGVLRLFDTREDLDQHVRSLLPVYLGLEEDTETDGSLIESYTSSGRITFCSSVEEACTGASIVQEQGPENLDFKKSTWARVVRCVSRSTHLWSSMSGILASQQAADLEDKSRLLIVHPFNPPHILPLIEIIPSKYTSNDVVKFAEDYVKGLGAGHRTVVLRKEITGFVGNRLGFALFREACHIVAEGVATVEDVDTVMESSLGPRWAVAGPFKGWNHGGGVGGLGCFMRNLAETIEACWDDAAHISFKDTSLSPYQDV